MPLLPRYASLLRIGEGLQGDPVTPGYVRWRQTWDLWTLVYLLRGEKLLGGRTGATSWTRLRSGRVRHKKKKKRVPCSTVFSNVYSVTRQLISDAQRVMARFSYSWLYITGWVAAWQRLSLSFHTYDLLLLAMGWQTAGDDWRSWDELRWTAAAAAAAAVDDKLASHLSHAAAYCTYEFTPKPMHKSIHVYARPTDCTAVSVLHGCSFITVHYASVTRRNITSRRALKRFRDCGRRCVQPVGRFACQKLTL